MKIYAALNILATISTHVCASSYGLTRLYIPPNVDLEDALAQYDTTVKSIPTLSIEQSSDEQAAQTLIHMAHNLLYNNLPQDAHVMFSEALYLQEHDEMTKDEDIAATLTAIAQVKRAMGDYDGAFYALSESLELQNDTKAIADTLLATGIVLMEGEYYEDSVRVLKEAINVQLLVVDRDIGDAGSAGRIAEINANLGEAYLRMDALENAMTVWYESAEVWTQLGDYSRVGDALNSLGVASFHMNDYGMASVLYEEALAQYNRVPSNANALDKVDAVTSNMSLLRIAMARSVPVDVLGHEEESFSSATECVVNGDISGVINGTRSCTNELAL